MLCFHFVKRTPFLSFPTISQGQKIAKKKQAKPPSRCDPIVTKSRAREMSTSGTSPYEENAQEIAILKKQMVEMIRMMQKLVAGGGLNSSSHSQGGPQIENENQPKAQEAMTRKQIPLRTGTSNLGMAKLRAKWKL